ncbi:sensor domain-containing phosphodiesterase [Seongchinamella unica]|uniref:Sensor domain-containing phosphodiesterase n=1 Tax=Seongchinamella unica TaxID=2547392 RepID=A0A4R5LS30_9GAMM|nr:GGDEF domain-containing phosphodiesterase [Seongchinamella unica]TDG13650.1 sensor domain-containing phosphodiesterase [Seongchinamella unica]
MSIATRFSLLFAAAIAVIGIVAGLATAAREYRVQFERAVERTESRLLGNPGLQYFIYSEDSAKLTTALEDFIAEQSSVYAQAFSGLGDKLAQVKRPGTADIKPAAFSLVRGPLMAADTGLRSFDQRTGAPRDSGFWAALTGGSSVIYHSLPVFTEVNTGRSGLTPADFAIALTSGSGSPSQRVVGYLHVVHDGGVVRAAALGAGLRVFLFSLGLAVVSGLLAWVFTRRVTRPFRDLANMADSVAAGEVRELIKVEGGGELQDIARLFNSVIQGFNDSRKVHEVDKHLLSLKVEERSSQLTERDEALSRVVGEAEQAQSRLHRLANYDRLTALPNRNLLTAQLELLLKLNQRNGHTLALLFIDLADFKRVNDSLGLSAGDQLLLEASKRIIRTVRDSDPVGRIDGPGTDINVARLSGDEFTVILNQLDSPTSAETVARRLHQNLSQAMTVDGHELVLHPAIGIAISPGDGKDVESLLKAASVAKFHAKQTGTDGIQMYTASMGKEGEERIRLESELRKAIENNALSLHYQPQIDTHSGSVVGAEALLRWNHPELGDIPPGTFVAIAEDIGLMRQLGDWALVEACRQLREFTDQGLKLAKMAINVSAEQFCDDFIQRVGSAIDQSGIEPRQLELGLTEAIMCSNDPETLAALRMLKESGVYLSVDDFGTGDSPLGYLARFPLDELKISRSFLLEATRSEAGARLVTAIIAMARHLGLKVLATGVETEAQFHFLTGNGAHLIQGYLFCEPVAAEDLAPMLTPWHFVDQVQKLADSAPDSAGAEPLKS